MRPTQEQRASQESYAGAISCTAAKYRLIRKAVAGNKFALRQVTAESTLTRCSAALIMLLGLYMRLTNEIEDASKIANGELDVETR